MFEGKTETEAREEILALVKEYCGTYHNQKKGIYARRPDFLRFSGV